jgi:hypothetical protein
LFLGENIEKKLKGVAVGWTAQADQGSFGTVDQSSVKAKLITLVHAVRTLLRSKLHYRFEAALTRMLNVSLAKFH